MINWTNEILENQGRIPYGQETRYNKNLEVKMQINLQEKRPELVDAAEGYFHVITNMVREDDKVRTGIQVVIRDLEDLNNMVCFPVGKPPDRSVHLASEKGTRALLKGHKTSYESRDPEKMQYGGSVQVTINGKTFQASVSGLKEEEDIAVATMLLSCVLDSNSTKIYEEVVASGGIMPEFTGKFCYLQQLLLCS